MPTYNSCGGLVACSHLEGPSGPLDSCMESCIGRDHWVALRAVLTATTAVRTELPDLITAPSLCSIGRDHICYNWTAWPDSYIDRDHSCYNWTDGRAVVYSSNVKNVKEEGREGKQGTSLGLGFWFIAALCTMISPSPHSCAQRFLPPGKFTLSVKPLPHFKTSSTLKPLPLLQYSHHPVHNTFALVSCVLLLPWWMVET